MRDLLFKTQPPFLIWINTDYFCFNILFKVGVAYPSMHWVKRREQLRSLSQGLSHTHKDSRFSVWHTDSSLAAQCNFRDVGSDFVHASFLSFRWRRCYGSRVRVVYLLDLSTGWGMLQVSCDVWRNSFNGSNTRLCESGSARLNGLITDRSVSARPSAAGGFQMNSPFNMAGKLIFTGPANGHVHDIVPQEDS